MAYEFGSLLERYIGAQYKFIPDGKVISSVTIGESAAPAVVAFTDDYLLGYVKNAKPAAKEKKTNVEYFIPGTGWEEREDIVITEDSLEVTTKDFAKTLYDQLAFGLASTPVADTPQQAFADQNRYKEGWLLANLYDDEDTIAIRLRNRIRLRLLNLPEVKNELATAAWKLTFLRIGGALNTFTHYPAS